MKLNPIAYLLPCVVLASNGGELHGVDTWAGIRPPPDRETHLAHLKKVRAAGFNFELLNIFYAFIYLS